MKDVREFYNKTATGWSDEYLEEKGNREILKKFIECFVDAGEASPRILDLGCGVGYDAKVLQEYGAKVVGVDISEKSIEIAKEHIQNGKFFVGDITAKLDKLGKFEGVVCIATIMHIDIEKMKTTFENIAEVLHNGGLLLLSSFDGTGKDMKKSLVKFNGETFDQNFNNYNAEMLCTFAHPNLKLVDMWKFGDFDDGWRYYVFEKTSNKKW